MKIAQIAPLYEAVPPKRYGGTERIVAYLTDALVDLGHDVTLFASAGTVSKGRLIPCRDQPLRLDPSLGSDLAAHLTMLDMVRARESEFDVLHFHIDLVHFPLFESCARKTLTTIHGRLDMKDIGRCFERYKDFPLVSISKNQRSHIKEASWIDTVYHGLPLSLQRPQRAPRGDYLAFLGRISPEKGPQAAIEIAKRANMPLRIAAKVDHVDLEFFKLVIEPLLDHPLIHFIGEIGDCEKASFLSNAHALLFPIDWPEPFGLVMIEAMACGTPVIAFNHGSVPEVIDDGVTGLIVDDIAQAVEAVTTVSALDRALIRQRFETRFSATAMARGYLDLYRRLAAPARRPLSRYRLEPLSDVAS